MAAVFIHPSGEWSKGWTHIGFTAKDGFKAKDLVIDTDMKEYFATNVNPISEAVYSLPVAAEVKHPYHHYMMPISDIIVDLNDNHKLTKHEIADWLDTLDVDLTVKP